jgi:hypothetical protein
MGMRYDVAKTAAAPVLEGAFDGGAWAAAAEGRVANFLKTTGEHRPDVRFRVLHDDAHLYVRFQVQDRYVRSVQTAYQGPVCTDSCVEFFVQPRPDAGYFNFEVNAGGTLLLFYIEDATRLPQGGFGKYRPVAPEWGGRVRIWHSLPAAVEPELPGPVTWQVAYTVPLALFEAHAGPLAPLSGRTWRANFYKCADKTSHPHWATWAPITKLNFHLPECFGELKLA